MKQSFAKIFKIANRDTRHILEQSLKLQEECGEVAVEVGRSLGIKSGIGKDGIRGECADIILAAISIYVKTGATVDDLEQDLLKKSDKWDKKLLAKDRQTVRVKKC